MRPDRRAALAALALAIASPTAAQDAPDTLRESYRDWVLACAAKAADDAGSATRRCEIAQELRTADTGQRVLRMALVREDDAGAAVTLVTPFGVRVADGVGIATAGGETAQVDFLTCLQGGCVATGTIGTTMLAALATAETATVTMNSTDGERIALEVSLAGFGAAWRRLDALD